MLNFVPYFKAMVGSKLNNEKGQGMVEYVLIIALIAIAVIVVLRTMGTTLSDTFQNVVDEL